MTARLHQKNDRAVMAAYGFPMKTAGAECVGEIIKHQTLSPSRKGNNHA